MNDKPNDTKPNLNQERWGRFPGEVMAGLRAKNVQIKCIDGKLYRGQLIGLSRFQLVLVQESGLEMVFSKGNVIYIHGV